MMQHVAPVHIRTIYTRLWRNDYWAIFCLLTFVHLQ